MGQSLASSHRGHSCAWPLPLPPAVKTFPVTPSKAIHLNKAIWKDSLIKIYQKVSKIRLKKSIAGVLFEANCAWAPSQDKCWTSKPYRNVLSILEQCQIQATDLYQKANVVVWFWLWISGTVSFLQTRIYCANISLDATNYIARLMFCVRESSRFSLYGWCFVMHRKCFPFHLGEQ